MAAGLAGRRRLAHHTRSTRSGRSSVSGVSISPTTRTNAVPGGHEVSSRCGVPAAGEQPAQRQGLIGRHRHALSVNGIKGAERVAEDQQALREVTQPFIAVPHAGGETEHDRVV
jgi:hypothetical protein